MVKGPLSYLFHTVAERKRSEAFAVTKRRFADLLHPVAERYTADIEAEESVIGNRPYPF